MPEWITRYWMEWIFGLLCAVLAGVYRSLTVRLKKQKEEQDALKNGLRALLRRQIISDCESCIREGYCPVTTKDTILDMYQCYHALGGNGTVSAVKEVVMNLPTVLLEEEREHHGN